MMITMTRR